MPNKQTASDFVKRLDGMRSTAEAKKYLRYFKTGPGEYGEGDVFMGVRMGQVFTLAKEYLQMPPEEIEKLLESPIHEVRAGGCSIMAKQASHKKATEASLKALYELYLRRHDRINNWDLVDLAAYKVVGRYLANYGKSRNVLYKLARSKTMWERRTAIISTLHFISQGDLDDAVKIAARLLEDDEDLIHKATGWALREVGRRDRKRLLAFLDTHAPSMPRTALRYAIEHFDPSQRKHYLSLKAAG